MCVKFIYEWLDLQLKQFNRISLLLACIISKTFYLSNLSDIGGLWANISHSLRTTAETVLGFERRKAAAAKNVAVGREEKGRENAFSDPRRGSRKGAIVRKSRCIDVGMALENSIKRLSV